MVGHSWPASFGSLTFVFSFYVSLLFCNMGPFKARKVCDIAMARGIHFQFLFPTGFFFFGGGGEFCIWQCHRLSHDRVVRLFMPAAGARSKEAKINLMDCICPCREVEIDLYVLNRVKSTTVFHESYL